MSWWLYGLVAAGLFLVCGIGLFAWRLRRRRQHRRVRPAHRHSVSAIAARIERERSHQPIRWPRADPDHGQLGDERPTRTLPLIPGQPVCAVPPPDEPARVRPYLTFPKRYHE